MHSLCGTPDNLQPFDLTILCARAWTQCPAQGSLGALTAPRCKTTLNPNLHLNCSEGRKTLHSSAVTHLAPRTSSSTHKNSHKAYDPVSHRSMLSSIIIHSCSFRGECIPTIFEAFCGVFQQQHFKRSYGA